MNDEQKVKAIQQITDYWYQYGCNKSERLDGIIFAISAIVNMEDTCDGDSCTL